VGDFLHPCPHRRLAHRRDVFGGKANGRPQEILDGISAAIGRYTLLELGDVIVGQGRAAVVDEEVRLPECELRHRQPLARRSQGEVSPGRAPVEASGAACRFEQNLEILELAVDRVQRRVTGVAAPPAVVVEDGEALGQSGRQGRACAGRKPGAGRRRRPGGQGAPRRNDRTRSSCCRAMSRSPRLGSSRGRTICVHLAPGTIAAILPINAAR
jgi:hypothetical protein